jgi:hypothetical protein
LCAAASRQLSEVQRPSNHAVVTRSAAHLAAILFPATLRRLYIVRDDDRAGDGAMNGLIERARAAGIEAVALSPRCGDFNEDLRSFGLDALRAAVSLQIMPADVAGFLGHERMGRDGG